MKISAQDLARELKKDRRTVTNWFNETPGLPSTVDKARRRVVDLAALLDWWAERAVRHARAAWEREVRPADPEDGMRAARQRKETALAQKLELEVAEIRGELLPLDMYETRLTRICQELAARVKTLGRFRGEVQRAMTEREAAQLLEEIIDYTLKALMSVADEIKDPEEAVTT